MVTRTWIGGGNNQASSPTNWSPTGAPQSGDLLRVVANTDHPGPFTFNVSGNDLAGDLVDIGQGSGGGAVTANLSHQAIMHADELETFTTFNLSQNSTLMLDMAKAGATVNIDGNDTLFFIGGFSFGNNINISPGSKWNGTFSETIAGNLAVNGGSKANFNNNGASLAQGTQVQINAAVIGKGSIDVLGFTRMEFIQSVGPNQSITDQDGSLITIDQPNQFAATMTLGSAEIDLIGLVNATSYSFKKDLLSIFAGNKVIDSLKLHDTTPNGFVVQQASGSVNILAITDPTNPPIGLPVHT